MYTYSLEKLDVWNLSKKLAVTVYTITNDFPSAEKFGMVSQLRRAVVSVCSNIAEGSSRRTPKDQAHFYTVSYGSLVEVLSQILISKDLGWIKDDALTTVRTDIVMISRKLNVLRNTILNPET